MHLRAIARTHDQLKVKLGIRPPSCLSLALLLAQVRDGWPDRSGHHSRAERPIAALSLYSIIIVYFTLTFHLTPQALFTVAIHNRQPLCTASLRPAFAGLRPPVPLWLSQRGPVHYSPGPGGPGPGVLLRPLARLRQYRKGYLQVS